MNVHIDVNLPGHPTYVKYLNRGFVCKGRGINGGRRHLCMTKKHHGVGVGISRALLVIPAILLLGTPLLNTSYRLWLLEGKSVRVIRLNRASSPKRRLFKALRLKRPGRGGGVFSRGEGLKRGFRSEGANFFGLRPSRRGRNISNAGKADAHVRTIFEPHARLRHRKDRTSQGRGAPNVTVLFGQTQMRGVGGRRNR